MLALQGQCDMDIAPFAEWSLNTGTRHMCTPCGGWMASWQYEVTTQQPYSEEEMPEVGGEGVSDYSK